jgi:predicted esterase
MEKVCVGLVRASGRSGALTMIVGLMLMPLTAVFAATVIRQPVTVAVGGQQVQFTAGQQVTLIGVNNGVAMVRVALSNGSLTIAQIPAADLVQTDAAPQASPRPAATPYYNPVSTPSPAPRPFSGSLGSGRFELSADLGADILPATPGLATYSEAKARKDKNEFTIYIPQSYNPAKPIPLLVDAHGNGGTGPGEAPQWKKFADDIGFIAVCPTFESSVNTMDDWLKSDDKMLSNIMKRVLGSYNIDRKHVLFTGFSGGGFPTWYLATKDYQIFTALCFRSANFNGETYNLRSSIGHWRHRPVYMYLSDHDNPNINAEEPAGLAYLKKSVDTQNLKFDLLTNDNGHKSRPEIAAKWFQSLIQAPDTDPMAN